MSGNQDHIFCEGEYKEYPKEEFVESEKGLIHNKGKRHYINGDLVNDNPVLPALNTENDD